MIVVRVMVWLSASLTGWGLVSLAGDFRPLRVAAPLVAGIALAVNLQLLRWRGLHQRRDWV